MQDFARALADFVRDNQVWAAPIVLALAFCESLAFISLLVPAWGALVAIGALIGVSGISLDRKSTRLNSSHRCISYAVFCLKKKWLASTWRAPRPSKLSTAKGRSPRHTTWWRTTTA